MVRTGHVTKLYKNAGAPLCNVSDEATGAVYLRCPILLHLHATPLLKGSHVAFAPLQGGRAAVVLGILPGTADGKGFQNESVELDPDVDYPVEKVSVKDAVWRRGGAVVVVTETGSVVIDTKGSGQAVQVQLGSGSHLRISQGGVEPTERVLMAGPTREFLDGLVARINALESWVSTSFAAGSASADPGFIACAAAIKTTAPLTDLSGTGDELVADAILLSAEREGWAVEGDEQ